VSVTPISTLGKMVRKTSMATNSSLAKRNLSINFVSIIITSYVRKAFCREHASSGNGSGDSLRLMFSEHFLQTDNYY